MTVRVYVPCTLGRLRDVVASGGIGPTPVLAHAVTDAVRGELGDAGEEEWEYAASSAAAQASVGLLRAGEPARRVVLAVDVPAVRELPETDPTLVQVDDVVPFRLLAAVLADSREAEPTVAAARDALLADAPDADRLLDRCLDHELGWWGVQEVPQLLA